MRRTCLLFALSLTATLLFAVPASANLQAIVDDLRADGAIDPCAHTGAELRAALDDIGPDVDQYAPEFPELIKAALAARATGACSRSGDGDSGGGAGGGSGGGSTGGTVSGGSAAGGGAAGLGGDGAPASGSVAGEGSTPTPETPLVASPAVVEEAVPGAPAATQASDAPVPVLLLATLGGLMALGVLAWALARWWAFEPRWLVGTRHACTEAGYRASATWAEFSDWVRLGR
ncbi:MAG TPA: hypothetical protein VGW11_09925 [Solirubrobacteraceae bacterium]|nr:hypothetical protein [Solirubrobacteraceae bacterium]